MYILRYAAPITMGTIFWPPPLQKAPRRWWWNALVLPLEDRSLTVAALIGAPTGCPLGREGFPRSAKPRLAL